MGRTALMGWIAGTEVIKNNLQVAGVLMGGIGTTLPVTSVLGLNPAIHRIFDIKQSTGMGPPPHRAVGQAQGESNGMGQPSIGAGGDIQQMETTRKQKGVEGFGGGTARTGPKGILFVKSSAGLLVGFKNAPGKQGAHVQLGDPGPLQNRQGQLITEFCLGHSLGLVDEVAFVLQGGKLLQHRHDAIECRLHPGVVGMESSIAGAITEGMESTGAAGSQRR